MKGLKSTLENENIHDSVVFILNSLDSSVVVIFVIAHQPRASAYKIQRSQKSMDIISTDFAESPSCAFGCYNKHIIMEFDRHFISTAV